MHNRQSTAEQNMAVFGSNKGYTTSGKDCPGYTTQYISDDILRSTSLDHSDSFHNAETSG